ncbi:hypothetical protein [Candidatus Spongiihabitans sp.]|uniref:hypothetical protein n=1 Tax=Candidatus Spongiihabitans sp. TaxID=3101308 RepID=UPI003C7E7AA3
MPPHPVIARLVPGNPVIKPFGAAELLISRLRRKRVTLRMTTPQPVIARLVPGNPVNNCHAQRDSFSSVTLSSQKDSSPSDSPLPPNPSLPGLLRAIQLLNRSAQPNSLYRGYAANESRYA